MLSGRSPDLNLAAETEIKEKQFGSATIHMHLMCYIYSLFIEAFQQQ